jgi:Ca2+-transporting ATPase
MRPFYSQNTNDVLTHFDVTAADGLTTEEVRTRQEKYGYNQLITKKKKSFLQMFLAQFKSFMIIILLIAAAISGVVGVMEGEGLLDTFVILGILVLNAFIGAYQEHKAESSLEALKDLAAPDTKVLRDGMIKEAPTRELVPGDIVILETGAVVPADIRLIEAVNLKVQESALTGESVPVEKHTDVLLGDDISLGDCTNLTFSNSTVTYGRGRGVVTATLMFAQLVHVRNLHSNTRSSFAINPLNNKPLIGAILVSVAMALLVLLVPPIRDAFNLAEMDGQHWLFVILISLAPIPVVDLFKLFRINGTRYE